MFSSVLFSFVFCSHSGISRCSRTIKVELKTHHGDPNSSNCMHCHSVQCDPVWGSYPGQNLGRHEEADEQSTST